MGRRGRHKKIKSCDPFYKGPKAAAVKSGNLTTSKAGFVEQAIPRKVQDFMKRKPSKKTKKKEMKFDKKSPDTNRKASTRFHRKAGESKRDYFNRIDCEAAAAMAKSMLEGRSLSDRRKKHLRGRKEKLKEKRQKNEQNREDENVKDEVQFGEVVERPPSLTVKPRKAPLDKSSKSLLLHSLVMSRSGDDRDTSERLKAKKRKHMTPREQANMDKERERVITAYRLAKKQKMEQTIILK